MSKKISQLPTLSGPSVGGKLPLAYGGVTYGVVQGLELVGLTASDKATAQANGNAIAAANTAALQAAVTAVNIVGGGCIQIPAGDYWFQHGLIDVNVVCQLDNVDRITICGVGIGVTRLHIVDQANSNMFNLTGGSTYITIRDLTFDGNRTNQDQTLGVSGIRGDAFSGLWLENLHIHDIVHYGIGIEGFVQEYLYFENIKLENLGGDGFDQKNKSDANLFQVANNITVTNFGLHTLPPDAQTVQTGWDCRGAWQISNFVAHFTVADGSGMRFRNGNPGEPDVGFGGHRSHVTNVEIYGPGAASTSTGIECVARDVKIHGGYVRDVLFGVGCYYDVLTAEGAERCTFNGLTAEACGTAGFITSDGAQGNTFDNCTAIGATYGFRIRSANCRITNPQYRDNVTAAISVDTTGTNCEIVLPKRDTTGAAPTLGLDINGADCKVLGGNISGSATNCSVTAARFTAIGTTFLAATVDNVLVAVGGDDATFEACNSRSATSEGYQTRAARTTIRGGQATGNGGLGFQSEGTATDCVVDSVYMVGNAADFDDQGSNTVIRQRQLVGKSLNEAVAAAGTSANIDIPIISSTTVMFLVEAQMEDSASARCTVRTKVQAYRSGAAAAVVSAGTNEFTTGAGLTINLSGSGNNLRVSVTKSAGNNCRLDTRITEIFRQKTVEFS